MDLDLGCTWSLINSFLCILAQIAAEQGNVGGPPAGASDPKTRAVEQIARR